MRYILFQLTGKVQGVNFRVYTREMATCYYVKGWIKNNQDGSVSGEAFGDIDNIELFIKSLKKGPINSKVENVFIEEKQRSLDYTDFIIKI